METLELKESIYKKIEEVSGKKTLNEIYALLENNSAQHFELTDEEAEEIDNDVKDYLSGKTKGYTREEVKKNIRKTA
jgi:putative addiction module component (TIGR02574 family)